MRVGRIRPPFDWSGESLLRHFAEDPEVDATWATRHYQRVASIPPRRSLMPRSLRSARVLFAVISVVASPVALFAQNAGRALTIEDYYRVKTVGAPDLSPNGRWVAFTVSSRVEATNGNTSEVWIVPSDASAEAKRVSAEGSDASAPAWLDDGRLRFASSGSAMVYDP